MIGQASQGIANAGAYRASGYIGQGNSWATTMNQLGELAGEWAGAGNYGGYGGGSQPGSSNGIPYYLARP